MPWVSARLAYSAACPSHQRKVRVWSVFLCTRYLDLVVLNAGCLSIPVITAIYVFCFGTMLFLFEMHFRRFELFVIMNFGFMCSWRGRAFFLLFCGSLCCGLGIIGLIVAIFSLLNGFFNL